MTMGFCCCSKSTRRQWANIASAIAGKLPREKKDAKKNPYFIIINKSEQTEGTDGECQYTAAFFKPAVCPSQTESCDSSPHYHHNSLSPSPLSESQKRVLKKKERTLSRQRRSRSASKKRERRSRSTSEKKKERSLSRQGRSRSASKKRHMRSRLASKKSRQPKLPHTHCKLPKTILIDSKSQRCPNHPYIELQRLSRRTGKWKTLLNSCPLCSAMDEEHTAGSDVCIAPSISTYREQKQPTDCRIKQRSRSYSRPKLTKQSGQRSRSHSHSRSFRRLVRTSIVDGSTAGSDVCISPSKSTYRKQQQPPECQIKQRSRSFSRPKLTKQSGQRSRSHSQPFRRLVQTSTVDPPEEMLLDSSPLCSAKDEDNGAGSDVCILRSKSTDRKQKHPPECQIKQRSRSFSRPKSAKMRKQRSRPHSHPRSFRRVSVDPPEEMLLDSHPLCRSNAKDEECTAARDVCISPSKSTKQKQPPQYQPKLTKQPWLRSRSHSQPRSCRILEQTSIYDPFGLDCTSKLLQALGTSPATPIAANRAATDASFARAATVIMKQNVKRVSFADSPTGSQGPGSNSASLVTHVYTRPYTTKLQKSLYFYSYKELKHFRKLTKLEIQRERASSSLSSIPNRDYQGSNEEVDVKDTPLLQKVLF